MGILHVQASELEGKRTISLFLSTRSLARLLSSAVCLYNTYLSTISDNEVLYSIYILESWDIPVLLPPLPPL